MASKSKAKAKPKRAGGRKAAAGVVGGGPWRMRDLPPELQDELRKGVEETKRRDGLLDVDEAIEEADRMSDEIVDILTRERRPSE